MTATALTLLALATAAPAAAPAADPFERFARQVERGLTEKREDALVLDLDELGKFATANVDVSEKVKTGFVTGMKRGARNQIGKQLASRVADGGSVKLLRVTPRGEGARALYRLRASDGGLDYAELFLVRKPSGEVAVVDFYGYMSGQSVGDWIRRLFITAAAELDMGLLDRLQGKERVWVENLSKVNATSQAVQQKKWREALALHDQLPEAIRKDRMLMLLRLQAAQGVGEDALYQKAIGAFEAAFPGDPSLDLVSVDGAVLRKDWDGAVACLDRLDQRVHDPYLSVMSGSLLKVKGDREGARRRMEAALAADKTLADAYWVLLTIALEDKDHARTAELLDGVEANTAVRFKDLTTVPQYASFVKSKQYREWQKRHAAAGAAQDGPPGERSAE